MLSLNAPLQVLSDPVLREYGVRLLIKREDLIHPEISGNKWRKLKYNITRAQEEGHSKLLTFGGAYSNHILATAAAGKKYDLKTTGIIRGEEQLPLNPTLHLAAEYGMEFYYMDRSSYREKHNPQLLDSIKDQFGKFYLIPEGGANEEGIQGCTEILQGVNESFDYVCCPCGTGTTLKGLIAGLKPGQKALGFSVLKGADFLDEEIKQWTEKKNLPRNWEIIQDYHFNGYAKFNQQLLGFIRQFHIRNQIPLDFIYTGKMMFGIYDLVHKGYFKEGETVLIIHTGGIQGNKGMEERFGIKL